MKKDFEKIKEMAKQKPGPKPKEEKPQYTSFIELDDGIAEMTFDPDYGKTMFAVFKDGEVSYQESFQVDGKTVKPYPGNKDIVKNKVVLFPSTALKVESEAILIQEIQAFIHYYLDIDPFYETIAAYYVLFTWVYDDFNELPYLRTIGDYGSGKTRFLQTIGSICYKPIFAGGATTVSPIFRMINDFRGTLILDEADFRFSDKTSEIIKILNNGFAKGFPVLRSEGKGTFDVKAFDVFGPKVIGTRQRFQDKALESRFLVEEMGKGKLRDDIPLNIPNCFWDEATVLRNKLLYWRFLNRGKKQIDVDTADRSIEPRLNQIIAPLASVISDSDAKEGLKLFIKKYNSEIIADRSTEMEGQVFDIILSYLTTYSLPGISMQMIADTFNLPIQNFKEKVSAKKVGWVVRERLHLKTEKTREGFVLAPSNKDKIALLKDKFGIKDDREHVNVVNVAETLPLIKDEKATQDSDQNPILPDKTTEK